MVSMCASCYLFHQKTPLQEQLAAQAHLSPAARLLSSWAADSLVSFLVSSQIMLLTDPEVESSLLISLDEGASYQKHSLAFDILSLLFHPEQEDWILAYSHDQKVACSCRAAWHTAHTEGCRSGGDLGVLFADHALLRSGLLDYRGLSTCLVWKYSFWQ